MKERQLTITFNDLLGSVELKGNVQLGDMKQAICALIYGTCDISGDTYDEIIADCFIMLVTRKALEKLEM